VAQVLEEGKNPPDDVRRTPLMPNAESSRDHGRRAFQRAFRPVAVS
jgi:hypothetical protein